MPYGLLVDGGLKELGECYLFLLFSRFLFEVLSFEVLLFKSSLTATDSICVTPSTSPFRFFFYP